MSRKLSVFAASLTNTIPSTYLTTMLDRGCYTGSVFHREKLLPRFNTGPTVGAAMALEDAFDHIETAEDLEGEAEEHRERALHRIENELQEQFGPDNDVDVTGFDGNFINADVWVGDLEDTASTIREETDQLVTVDPVEIQICRPLPEIDLSSETPIQSVEALIDAVHDQYGKGPGAPLAMVIQHAQYVGMDSDSVRTELDALGRKGKVYEPKHGFIRTT